MTIVGSMQQRLAAIDPPVFSVVGGAADFAAIFESGQPKAYPAVFVFVEEEQSSEERDTGPMLQRTEVDIAVIIVTKNLGDAAGAAASADVERLKADSRKALLGFVPGGAEDPLAHIAGNLIKARNGLVWHRDLYGTAYFLEEQS